MFSIVQIGSRQYKVAEGDLIEADRQDVKPGKSLNLDKVLLYAKGNDVRIGQPHLKDVKVSAEVVGHSLDDKVIAFKNRRRKGYSRKVGHRQKLTALSIKKIAATESK